MNTPGFFIPEAAMLLAQLDRLPQNRPLWLTYTLPWSEHSAIGRSSLAALVEAAPRSPRAYWESSAHSLGLVGWGKAAELTDWGRHRFEGIQGQAERLATHIFPVNPEAPMDAGPHWIGSFSFQPTTGDNELWRSFPDAYFLLPRIQITRQLGQSWLTMNLLVETANDAAAIEAYFKDCLEDVDGVERAIESPEGNQANRVPCVEIHAGLDQDTWTGMVTGALEKIAAGELKKVVLARTLEARFEQPACAGALLDKLAERYPDCYRFMIEPQPGQYFIGASPELLAEVRAPFFRSTALAGTIRRGKTADQDDRLGQELMDDPKERHEHAIVVDTIAENLSSLAAEVQVASEPALRKLGNLQHLETPIHGRLAPGRGVLEVVAALHPTPAMGGWPPGAAQDYLNQAEQFSRGWYAAPIGWFDPWGNGLFAVGIRSGLFRDKTATLFAGAGIVAGSDPANEWRETELKFRPLVEAIGEQLQDG